MSSIFWLTILGLLIIGLYGLLAVRNLFKLIITLQILVKAAVLALVVAGQVSGRIQLGQSLAVTVIVADFSFIGIGGGSAVKNFQSIVYSVSVRITHDRRQIRLAFKQIRKSIAILILRADKESWRRMAEDTTALDVAHRIFRVKTGFRFKTVRNSVPIRIRIADVCSELFFIVIGQAIAVAILAIIIVIVVTLI